VATLLWTAGAGTGNIRHFASLTQDSIMRLLLFFFAGLLPLGAQEKARRNVLLICVDDLKPTLGCYGDPLAKTPNVDKLAARGMRFNRASCTQAVCAPSRNNLMLGSRSTSLGIYDLSVNFRKAVPDAITMPQWFMKHGYRAEAVGKILHTGHGNVDDAASWSVPTVPFHVVEYLKPESTDGGKLTREEAYFGNKELGRIHQLPKGAAWENAEVADNAYSDGKIADEIILRLRGAKERGTPFFIACGFTKPHLPFTAPKKYWEMHDPKAFPLAKLKTPPEGAPPYAGKRGGEIVNYTPVPENGQIGDDLARELIHGYYAATSYMDAQLGRVMEEFDKLGLAENTVIVLWGDHGWHLGDHGMWTKHTNYEENTRIPVLVVAPGVTKPGSTGGFAETVDLYPTLVELAGLPKPEVPQPMDGLSLVPVLKDPAVKVRDHITHCFPRGEGRLGRAIRTERYRMVEWKRPGEPAEKADIELYDYQAELPEVKNLAAERPEIVKELRALLEKQGEALARAGRK
jgi:iduronate 2-sulfatase